MGVVTKRGLLDQARTVIMPKLAQVIESGRDYTTFAQLASDWCLAAASIYRENDPLHQALSSAGSLLAQHARGQFLVTGYQMRTVPNLQQSEDLKAYISVAPDYTEIYNLTGIVQGFPAKSLQVFDESGGVDKKGTKTLQEVMSNFQSFVKKRKGLSEKYRFVRSTLYLGSGQVAIDSDGRFLDAVASVNEQMENRPMNPKERERLKKDIESLVRIAEGHMEYFSVIAHRLLSEYIAINGETPTAFIGMREYLRLLKCVIFGVYPQQADEALGAYYRDGVPYQRGQFPDGNYLVLLRPLYEHLFEDLTSATV